jgi:hypothetical protein
MRVPIRENLLWVPKTPSSSLNYDTCGGNVLFGQHRVHLTMAISVGTVAIWVAAARLRTAFERAPPSKSP